MAYVTVKDLRYRDGILTAARGPGPYKTHAGRIWVKVIEAHLKAGLAGKCHAGLGFCGLGSAGLAGST